MPKKKSQRNSRAVVPSPPTTVKRWVKWSAIAIIVALLAAVMLTAITSTPSNAATPPGTPTICQPIDTDNDGIKNNNDSDIDGDGIVNGKDDDIDGDGILNANDNDPAATNCEKSTTPPVLNENLTTDGTPKAPQIGWQWIVGVLAVGFGYLTLRQTRRRK